MSKILANTYATEYGFIDKEFVEIVCQVLEIKSRRLIKPKQIQGFDVKAAKSITHTIYPILAIGTYIESLALLFIT